MTLAPFLSGLILSPLCWAWALVTWAILGLMGLSPYNSPRWSHLHVVEMGSGFFVWWSTRFLSLLLFQKRLLHLGKINRHSINAADMTAHPLRTCGNFCGIGWSRWFDALITEAHVKRHNGKYWLVFCSYIIWNSSLQILIHFTPLSS